MEALNNRYKAYKGCPLAPAPVTELEISLAAIHFTNETIGLVEDKYNELKYCTG
jgi:hypothetical protein